MQQPQPLGWVGGLSDYPRAGGGPNATEEKETAGRLEHLAVFLFVLLGSRAGYYGVPAWRVVCLLAGCRHAAVCNVPASACPGCNKGTLGLYRYIAVCVPAWSVGSAGTRAYSHAFCTEQSPGASFLSWGEKALFSSDGIAGVILLLWGAAAGMPEAARGKRGG